MLKRKKFFSEDEAVALLDANVGSSVMTGRGSTKVLGGIARFNKTGMTHTILVEFLDEGKRTVVEVVDVVTFERTMWARTPEHETHKIKQRKVKNDDPSEGTENWRLAYAHLSNR